MELKFLEQRQIYYCVSSYDERAIPKGAGMCWDRNERHWWTKDVKVASKLAKYASDEVRASLTRAAHARAERIAASKATDAAITIPLPEGLECPPFQRAGVAYAVSHRNTLIADEMGLGKTVQAIAACNVLGSKKILIICPASLKINWSRECSKWLYNRGLRVHVANNSVDTTADVVIVNYDILGKFMDALLSCNWDVAIIDEAHYCKNKRTQRTINTKKLVQKAARKVALTGTPICNRPSELFSLLDILESKLAKTWWTFAKRYCDAHHNGYGWDYTGAAHLDELQEKLRDEIMVRRLKKEVLTELPAKRRQIIMLPANGASRAVRREQETQVKFEAQKEALQAQADLARAQDDTAAYERAVAALAELKRVAFTEMARLRHETAVAKVPAVVEHVLEMLAAETKIVLFAHHHDVIDALETGLSKYHPVRLTGLESIEARQRAVDSFQGDSEVRLFVGSIQASGLGITLTAASTVVFAELDWVPGNITQAEDRCHRIGQINSVLIQHVVLDGSIDATLAKTLVKKQEIIDRALDEEAVKPVIAEAVIETNKLQKFDGETYVEE
jgi:SWI/SNF-related matrix-associated actin-dependent regulator 1 of chromatin subfamily A